MNRSQMKIFFTALTKHQMAYIEKYQSLKNYVEEQLPQIYHPEEIEKLQRSLKKEQMVLKDMYEEMAKLQKFLKESCRQPAKAKIFDKFNQEFISGFNDSPPSCKSLFDSISLRKHEIKKENDPAQILKKLIGKFSSNDLDPQAFNDFLMHPAVKSKMKVNPLFATKVENLNKLLIIRYARTIASIDQELFLGIDQTELFSPWSYRKGCPTIAANTAQYNNISEHVCRLILAPASIEERTIIVQRWIGVAYFLFEELKDYSGAHAILAAFSHNEVSRLERTFEGISQEAKDALTKLSAELVVNTSLKPILNAQQAVIPAMALIQRDITFIEDGNPSVKDLKDKNERREEMILRTGAGRRISAIFNKLQMDRRNFVIPNDLDSSLNELLRDKLVNPGSPYDSDQADIRSKELEPIKNQLKVAKPIKLDKVFKISNDNNQPLMRQVLLEELLSDLNNYIISNPSIFLKQKKQETFHIEGYVIDWEKESKELDKLYREMEAFSDALKGYATNEKNTKLVTRTMEMRSQLMAIDFKQLKLQNLENTYLKIRIFKLKQEFANASRFNGGNPDIIRINEIISELEEINKLIKDCPVFLEKLKKENEPSKNYNFSIQFLKLLEAFNDEVKAYKTLPSTSKDGKDNSQIHEEQLKSSARLRCRYSMLYAPLRQENKVEEEVINTLSNTVVCA